MRIAVRLRNDLYTNPKRQRGICGLPRLRFGLVCAATALILCAGCDRHYDSIFYQPNENDRPKPPSEVADFPTLFANNCSGCHGAGGLQGPAPPIGNELFLAMSSEEQLREIIAKGRPGTLMPPFVTTNGEGLTPQQVEIIAKEMKGNGLRSASGDKPPLLFPPYHSGPASSDPADVAAGSKLFAEHCAQCHGHNGRDGAIAGALNEPALLELLSDQAIRTLIITGRPDLQINNKDPMSSYLVLAEVTPDNAEAKWREIDQIVAYIASWRKAAAQTPVATPAPMKKEADR